MFRGRGYPRLTGAALGSSFRHGPVVAGHVQEARYQGMISLVWCFGRTAVDYSVFDRLSYRCYRLSYRRHRLSYRRYRLFHGRHRLYYRRQVVLPLVLGQVARATPLQKLHQYKPKAISRLSELVLLTIIYTTFCDAFGNRASEYTKKRQTRYL